MNEHQTWRGRRCSSSSQNQHFESSVSQIKLAQSYGRGREREREEEEELYSSFSCSQVGRMGRDEWARRKG
jgi:hypothetical protein